jgi:hypothetical protein
MRKIFILFGLLLTLSLNGQILPGIVASQKVTAGGGAFDGGMIKEGGFQSTTYWAFGTSWTRTGTNPYYATYNDASQGFLRQADADMLGHIAPNTNYRLEFDIGIGGGGYAYIYFTNYATGVTYVAYNTYNNGHNSVDFTTSPDVSGGGFGVYGNDGSSATYTITNISLKVR